MVVLCICPFNTEHTMKGDVFIYIIHIKKLSVQRQSCSTLLSPVKEMPHFMPEVKSKFRLHSAVPRETAPAMFVFVDNATFPPTHLVCIEQRRNEIRSQCRGEMPGVNAKGVIRLFINHGVLS